MFAAEVAFAYLRRKYGQQAAVEVSWDIHERTELHGRKNSVDLPYLSARQLFDFNEHFIELGSPGDGRSLDFMVLALLSALLLAPIVWLLASTVWWTDGSDMSQTVAVSLGVGLLLLVGCGFGIFWSVYLRASFFTALTARYRFNRTSGKVYVLRPRQFGGNAVLDWDHVKAHPKWCAPRDLEPGFQNDPAQLARRQSAGGGPYMRRGLVLYWPPHDSDDAERKGEDFILVGDWLSDGSLWEYIRVFMEEGIEAVPTPEPDEYRRKGRSSMWQHLWEEQFDSIVREARLRGNSRPGSAPTLSNYLEEVPFLPFNSAAQWLCWWPTFPKEWNSDCGQKRRESGIGPEEPMRWVAKVD